VDYNYTRAELYCIELLLESGLNLGPMCRIRVKEEKYQWFYIIHKAVLSLQCHFKVAVVCKIIQLLFLAES
jgi:hypothetical protein